MLNKPIAAAALCLLAAGLLLPTAPPARACLSYIGWIADLTAAGSGTSTAPAGTARMLYDFNQPFGTLIVQTHGLTGVTRIEVRAARSTGDVAGPAIAVVYDASKDGPFKGVVTRVLHPSDMIPQTSPRIMTIADFGTAIFHNGAVVAVCTRAHPRGAVAGLIRPRRVVVYSDVQGSFHDPKLHRQASADRAQ